MAFRRANLPQNRHDRFIQIHPGAVEDITPGRHIYRESVGRFIEIYVSALKPAGPCTLIKPGRLDRVLTTTNAMHQSDDPFLPALWRHH